MRARLGFGTPGEVVPAPEAESSLVLVRCDECHRLTASGVFPIRVSVAASDETRNEFQAWVCRRCLSRAGVPGLKEGHSAHRKKKTRRQRLAASIRRVLSRERLRGKADRKGAKGGQGDQLGPGRDRSGEEGSEEPLAAKRAEAQGLPERAQRAGPGRRPEAPEGARGSDQPVPVRSGE